jgi:hypothetical protein
LLVNLTLVQIWAAALSPQAVWLGIALLSGGGAAIAAALALFRREPLLGPKLNRLDEATAPAGVHFLVLERALA